MRDTIEGMHSHNLIGYNITGNGNGSGGGGRHEGGGGYSCGDGDKSVIPVDGVRDV